MMDVNVEDMELNAKELVLSEDEIRALIVALADGADPEKGVTSDEIARWIDWCAEARISNTVVELVIRGVLAVQWLPHQDEPSFRTVERISDDAGNDNNNDSERDNA